MTDAERLAELRRKVEGIPGEWPERRDRRWILAQLDANGTHPQCRRCVVAETVGRLTP